MRYTKLIITLIIGLAMDMAAEGITADSIFIQNSRPIKFIVNRINISDQDIIGKTKSAIWQNEKYIFSDFCLLIL